MKKIINPQTYIFLFSLLMLSLTNAISFAQDSAANSSSQTTTTTTTEHTTTIPSWAWIVGGVVVLIIIIALVRGNKGGGTAHTDKVTYTKTTSSDNT